MPPRIKEEERIENIIHGLLKQPENKRCINCISLGPQYVCTTFWTFVCTNYSGVHRELTHPEKSVSMAKSSAEEVGSLQAGGNERTRLIYFKTWDPQRNFYPDASEQGISGGSNDPFASVNPIHQANREESWQVAPHTPSRGVNPFG